jgi:hypothetical protein
LFDIDRADILFENRFKVEAEIPGKEVTEINTRGESPVGIGPCGDFTFDIYQFSIRDPEIDFRLIFGYKY